MTKEYPIYVISKGRADSCLTARMFVKEKAFFYLVIESQEQELYQKNFSKEHILVLPFSNLGLGSVPARNWVWEHSIKTGHERHWILDDNIRCFYRRYKGQRIPCEASAALSICGNFFNRYENVAIGGLNYSMFCPDREKRAPFFLNCHVYSCLCILNKITNRWRGKYNEDTDLCLQVLADGWCTILMNAFLIDKMKTMKMKGGNMDELYKGTGRLEMARSLERLWPGVVSVKRRFGRPQHVIKNAWKDFSTPLKLKSEVDSKKEILNGQELELKQVKEIKSKMIKDLLTTANKTVTS